MNKGYVEILLPLAQTLKNVVVHRALERFPCDVREVLLVEAILSLKADIHDLSAKERWIQLCADPELLAGGRKGEMESFSACLDNARNNSNSPSMSSASTNASGALSNPSNNYNMVMNRNNNKSKNNIPKPSTTLSWFFHDDVLSQEMWNSLGKFPSIVLAGSTLPSERDTPVSVLTNRPIKGPAHLLEDGKAAISLEEALLWGRVNSLSPLNTGFGLEAV